MTLNQQLGKRIRQLRKAKGFTQEDMCTSLSIGRASLSNIENGNCGTGLETLKKMADTFGISLSTLFVFDEMASPDNNQNAISAYEYKIMLIDHRISKLNKRKEQYTLLIKELTTKTTTNAKDMPSNAQ